MSFVEGFLLPVVPKKMGTGGYKHLCDARRAKAGPHMLHSNLHSVPQHTANRKSRERWVDALSGVFIIPLYKTTANVEASALLTAL